MERASANRWRRLGSTSSVALLVASILPWTKVDPESLDTRWSLGLHDWHGPAVLVLGVAGLVALPRRGRWWNVSLMAGVAAAVVGVTARRGRPAHVDLVVDDMVDSAIESASVGSLLAIAAGAVLAVSAWRVGRS